MQIRSFWSTCLKISYCVCVQNTMCCYETVQTAFSRCWSRLYRLVLFVFEHDVNWTTEKFTERLNKNLYGRVALSMGLVVCLSNRIRCEKEKQKYTQHCVCIKSELMVESNRRETPVERADRGKGRSLMGNTRAELHHVNPTCDESPVPGTWLQQLTAYCRVVHNEGM